MIHTLIKTSNQRNFELEEGYDAYLNSSVRTDHELIEQFLQERCFRSIHTQMSYRTQLRRLGWYCKFIGLPSIRAFKRENWTEYQQYLRNPPATHIMRSSVGIDHQDWAPFRGPLSPASAIQSEIVSKSFFEWLSDPAVGEILVNPVSSVRTHTQRRSATKSGIERYINDVEWTYITKAIESMSTRTIELTRMKARAKWIIDLAVLTGLRASEISDARIGNIKTGSLPGQYCLNIIRKGNIESSIPLLEQVIQSHNQYMNLYENTWIKNEDQNLLPLVLPVRLNSEKKHFFIKPQTRAHIWRIFKDIMLMSSDLAKNDGNIAAQERLNKASTHWLRHTFGTRLLDAGADIRSVRDLMDHASITTTNQYLHRPEEKLRSDMELMEKMFKT